MERLRILISGMIAGDPQQGGATWAVLQYVLGLRSLGHDVKLVEPVERIEARTAAYFREVVSGSRWATTQHCLSAARRRRWASPTRGSRARRPAPTCS